MGGMITPDLRLPGAAPPTRPRTSSEVRAFRRRAALRKLLESSSATRMIGIAAGRDLYGMGDGFLGRRRCRGGLEIVHRREVKLGDPVEGCRAAVGSSNHLGGDEFLQALEALRRDHRRVILRVCSLEHADVSWRRVDDDQLCTSHGFFSLSRRITGIAGFVCDRGVPRPRRTGALLMAAILIAGCGRGSSPPESAPAPSAAPAARSVLLVTVDTLRADRLGCYGDTRARTPRIDALAAAGTALRARVHARARSPCPPTRRCSPGSSRRPTACAATAPLPWPRAWPPSPRHSPRTAAAPPRSSAAFRSRAGSASTAGSATTTTGWGSHPASTTSSPRGARTPSSTPRSRWLAQRPGDVFVWVHLFDPHAPYDPPPAFAHDDPYRGEIAAVDAAVGRLLDAWDARPGPAIVALTADHGEAFGEHGEESHSLFVYDVTLRVPLVLKGAALRQAAGASRCPSSISARRSCRWAARRHASRRQPLRRRGHDAPPVRRDVRAEVRLRLERAARDPRRAAQVHPRAAPGAVRRRVPIPARLRNLAGAHPEVVARLSDALDAVLDAAGEKPRRGAPWIRRPPSGLRSLGYVQGIGEGGTGADPKDKVQVALRIARATGPFRDHAAAAAAYREIAALDPDVPIVNFRLADALLRSGRAAESIPYYPEGDRVVARGPPTRSSDWRPRTPGWAAWTTRRGRSREASARRSRQRPGALQPRARSPACAATARPPARAYQAALARPGHP